MVDYQQVADRSSTTGVCIVPSFYQLVYHRTKPEILKTFGNSTNTDYGNYRYFMPQGSVLGPLFLL